MTNTYTGKYTKIESGYMGQLVEWPEVVTEGATLEECRELLNRRSTVPSNTDSRTMDGMGRCVHGMFGVCTTPCLGGEMMETLLSTRWRGSGAVERPGIF